MSMFCNQCQEAAKGTGCTLRGVCGKTDDVANLQDLLIYVLKGISVYTTKLREAGIKLPEADKFIIESLFSTITNVNFDKEYFVNKIAQALKLRNKLKEWALTAGTNLDEKLPDAAIWEGKTLDDFEAKAKTVGLLADQNEDMRSLKSLVLYGVKGMAAYAYHAQVLGYEDDEVYGFMQKALATLLDDNLTADDLVALAMETGKYGVQIMALLDKANTSTYGNPEVTRVNIGVRNNLAY
jgi:6Fe-6S prismane cluster-containing protein